MVLAPFSESSGDLKGLSKWEEGTNVNQWFSTWMILSPGGCLAASEDGFGCHNSAGRGGTIGISRVEARGYCIILQCEDNPSRQGVSQPQMSIVLRLTNPNEPSGPPTCMYKRF